jgi:hypothetical protein
MLRRYVQQLRSSSINYGQLSVPVAQMTRQRQSEFSQLFSRLGDIRTVIFAGVTPEGEDLFDVRFDNGSMRWRMLPDGNGGIDAVGFTFLVNAVPVFPRRGAGARAHCINQLKIEASALVGECRNWNNSSTVNDH